MADKRIQLFQLTNQLAGVPQRINGTHPSCLSGWVETEKHTNEN